METALDLGNGENDAHLGTDAEELPLVKGARSVRREAPIEGTRTQLCLLNEATALQLAHREKTKEVKTIIQLVSDASFDADELPRQLARTENCKQTLNDIRDKNLA